jgi:hypothetical protein
LVALGTPKEPIIFTSDRGNSSAAGDWVGVTFGGTINPQTVMQYARVYYAGGAESGGSSCQVANRNPSENYAAIRIYGPPASSTAPPFITNSEIFESALDGIDRAWFANVTADKLPDYKSVNSFAAVRGCLQSTPKSTQYACPTAIVCP